MTRAVEQKWRKQNVLHTYWRQERNAVFVSWRRRYPFRFFGTCVRPVRCNGGAVGGRRLRAFYASVAETLQRSCVGEKHVTRTRHFNTVRETTTGEGGGNAVPLHVRSARGGEGGTAIVNARVHVKKKKKKKEQREFHNRRGLPRCIVPAPRF